MMDLSKHSHERYATNFFERISRVPITLQQRTHFLDMANDEELLGNYHMAEALRRLALGLPSRS